MRRYIKKILFSPVGSTDLNELDEAPVFRIQEHIKPDLTILYTSNTESTDKKTGIKVKMVEKVGEFADLLGNETRIKNKVLFNEECTAPDGYDYIFSTFVAELKNIHEQFPEADLTLNASSGTPAMKAALMVINELGLFNSSAYQAPDPRFSEDGVRQIQNNTLRNQLLLANVKKLIENYDYVGAKKLADTYSGEASEQVAQAISYIKGAYFRSILDPQEGPKHFGGSALKYNSHVNQLSEYLNILELKLLREEFGDFARALSPAFTEVFYIMLKNSGIERDDFSKLEKTGTSSKKSRVLDVEKVKQNLQFQEVFQDVLLKTPTKQFYYNTHLNNLLKSVEDANQELIELGDKIIRFESSIRNLAAHEMVKIDCNRIIKDTRTVERKNGGIDPNELLKQMAKITGVQLGLYARINQKILELL